MIFNSYRINLLVRWKIDLSFILNVEVFSYTIDTYRWRLNCLKSMLFPKIIWNWLINTSDFNHIPIYILLSFIFYLILTSWIYWNYILSLNSTQPQFTVCKKEESRSQIISTIINKMNLHFLTFICHTLLVP